MFSALDSLLETVTINCRHVTYINRVVLMSWLSIENYSFCFATLFLYIFSILLLLFATIARNWRGRGRGAVAQVDNRFCMYISLQSYSQKFISAQQIINNIPSLKSKIRITESNAMS